MDKRVMLLCAFLGMGNVFADLSSFVICDHTASQIVPAVDGSLVAWADDRNGTSNQDIYARILPGGVEQAICIDVGNQTNPAVSGSLIVWQDSRSGNDDIYMYNLSAQTETSICTTTGNQQNPDISGRTLVWQDNRDGNSDIYGYNLDTMTEFAICTHSASQMYPAISGNFVVWMDNRNGNYDIYGCDLSNLAAGDFAVCAETTADQYYPAIDGTVVIWQDERNTATKPDIYGRDLSGDTELAVCVLTERQNSPAICGNWIIWRDRRNKDTSGYDIYGYDMKTGQESAICTVATEQAGPAVSAGYVIWQDIRNGNYDIFGAAFPIEASITVVSPNGGDGWMAGSQQMIQWQSQGAVGNVKIEISDNNGTSWRTIADDAANSGQYEMTVPADVHSKQCLIRISDTSNEFVMDQSDAIFTIFQCSLTADLTGDCFVGLDDFALLAGQWLQCGNEFDTTWCQSSEL